ncbi:MAG: cytochrome c [Bdellovibrio sp.]|nr:cytochrome c [Bdellovibrio sp.]
MRLKIAIGFALVSAAAFVTTSCLSPGKVRTPTSAEYSDQQVQTLLQDEFSKDGYDHSLKRDFGGGKISDDQAVQELAGRTIWFKSAPNERHHTYIFPQKVGVGIDWNQAMDADLHDQRFQTWGLINDPDCCTPGVNCEQKNMRYKGRAVTKVDTYGWDYCRGDEDLLASLMNKTPYRDPACDDPIIKAADGLDSKVRENRCELAFGTSTGAVGYRKYPNPKFNAARWAKVGGYKGYSEQMIKEGINISIQPPFRVAMACASCHAAFDPLNPPKDLNNPSWANIKGETGNQYLNVSKLMANGMKGSAIETQLFTHVRPGVVDTSAVPHDFINNPGTMNAIINFPVRPTFNENVVRWFQVDSCNLSDLINCQKVAYKNEAGQVAGYKFWHREQRQMQVPHILKGGEDSVGFDLAVQRVYVNIGMCSEQCWSNHLTNLRDIDSTSRSYGESPFNIAQCREQCASFRANEDRVGNIFSYLASRRPTDLKNGLQSVQYQGTDQPVVPQSPNKALVDAKFKEFLEGRYGAGSLERGRQIFANNCAQCHSSQNNNSKENLSANENNFANVNFFATKTLDTGEVIRADWLGNDKSTPVAEVGTYKCRALHTNHKLGQVWQDFSSSTYKNLPSTTEDSFEKPVTGGPGYYRNISLLNVWAHAPFMHNNGIGPEICGNVEPKHQVLTTSVEGRQLSGTKYKCDLNYDPSVMGRLKLYELSMDELLTPENARRKKIVRIDEAIKFPLGFNDMYLEFPPGIPLNTIANFDLKAFLYDFTYAASYLDSNNQATFDQFWAKKFADNPAKAKELGAAVQTIVNYFKDVNGVLSFIRQGKAQSIESLKVIAKYYRTCDAKDEVENAGHNFKTDLSAADKNSLKAFMATF